jgi:hypothetical protein
MTAPNVRTHIIIAVIPRVLPRLPYPNTLTPHVGAHIAKELLSVTLSHGDSIGHDVGLDDGMAFRVQVLRAPHPHVTLMPHVVQRVHVLHVQQWHCLPVLTYAPQL